MPNLWHYICRKDIIHQNCKNMKTIYLFLILLVFNGISVFSQSNIIEIKNLTKRYERQEFDIYKYRKLARQWNDLSKKYGYPEIPYDTISKTFEYELVIPLENINKETIYNRILEHTSMKYDFLYNTTDYQDYDAGKIITKVEIPVHKSDGKTINYSFASRFIILDNKLKIEVFKMSIVYRYDVFDNGTVVITNYEKKYPVEDYFPITSVKNIHWEDRLKLLIQFNKMILEINHELVQFIKSYQEDYIF